MPILDLFWSMLMFFMLFIWIWLLIKVFADIFRRHDIGGWAKAFWILFVIILPFLGVLVYLIAEGGKMAQRDAENFEAMQSAQQDYIKSVAGSGGSTADQLEKLSALHDKGVLNDDEFAAQKAALLG